VGGWCLGGWVDEWMGGSKSCTIDCLQQLEISILYGKLSGKKVSIKLSGLNKKFARKKIESFEVHKLD
jgi:hypothetical protein